MITPCQCRDGCCHAGVCGYDGDCECFFDAEKEERSRAGVAAECIKILGYYIDQHVPDVSGVVIAWVMMNENRGHGRRSDTEDRFFLKRGGLGSAWNDYQRRKPYPVCSRHREIDCRLDECTVREVLES